MKGVEIFEVVEGEEEVRDSCCFAGVVFGAVIVISMIQIEVCSDLDGAMLTVCFTSLIVG